MAGARGDAEPYGDASAACCAARGVGQACEAGGVAERSTRLRFDFSHFAGVADEELQEIEDIGEPPGDREYAGGRWWMFRSISR